jgi:hypothetical protein
VLGPRAKGRPGEHPSLSTLSGLALGVLLVVTPGCGVEDYKFVPDSQEDAGDSGPVPPATPTVCTSDTECEGLPATTLCDLRSGYCVECVPDREEALDRCGEGLYCQADGRCGVGCANHADCPGITCDAPNHVCTGCTSNANCAPGTRCEGAVCVPGCSDDDTCPTGFSCCDGFCRNTLTDRASCGACGAPCEETGQCINGVCGPGPCETGLGECDGNAANGCETDLISNPDSCGRCRIVCASRLCSGGVCTTSECPDGFADCNADEADRCEASLLAIENCQMCGKECSAVNGEPSCSSRGCRIACSDGFGDCDDDVDTGCETDLVDDPDHCGACGTACSNDNGGARCVDGECRPTCAQGFDDCDGNPNNGCETDLGSTVRHCGACGERCDPPNAAGSCVEGVCEAACETGFEDCNGDASDGCEADLASPTSCGSCDNPCSDNGGMPVCNSDGTCGIRCGAGRADCINGLLDGCETNTNSSVLHCGTCANACPGAVGMPACLDGVCGVSTCTDPNAECDGNGATVCETNVTDDPDNCSACGMACFYPNATGICVNRGCLLDACDPGFEDCTAALGCETRLGTVDSCRSCGETCRNDHGTTSCESNGCVPTCQIGWGDCDGNRNNGCETQLNTLTNCGMCGRSCSTPHGTPSCAAGTCEITSCDAGWDDCDNTASTGCERPLNTLTSCGGCNVACNLPNASESCATGTCTLTTCNSGFRDCTSAQAGCETQLGTPTNCLSCGDACTNAHGTTSCNATTGCQPVCNTGWKSCDANAGNGCERNIRSLTDCGDCDVDCALANATESCGTGACTLDACSNGWGNCDANQANGCETPLGTLTNCLSCGNGCSNAHGQVSCNGTNGCQYTCSAGWDSCDANPSNGCETSIWTLNDCGACGSDCDVPNSSETCGGGMCTSTTCATGFAECIAGAPACETQLGTNANCRSCNEACSNAHGGATCNVTNGCTPVCDAGWKSCDGIADNGCEHDVRTLTSCGDCDVPCSFPNAAASCSTGSCSMGGCNSGFADCGAGAGCETQLGTASNCAACANACTNTHGSNACAGMPGAFDCSPTCDDGWKSCNGNPDDGCETSVTTLTDCVNCGQTCSFPNGGASCATGSCQPTGCNSGFADCTAVAGCETTLGTPTNCAACGNACTNAHGTNSCAGTPGMFDCSPTCSGFWRNCNSNPDDGCETSIETLTDCGSCGTPCNFANAAETCPSGVCTLGACTAGFANCDAQTGNGCETTLGSSQNCNGCGNACTNSHGTTSCVSTGSGTFDCSPTCSSGWFNCTNPDDGCETDANVATVWAASGNGRVTVSWTPVSAATSYVVRRATTSGGPYTNVATGLTGTTFVNTGLTNGTTYYYVVAAVVPCGTGPNSAQRSAVPDAQLVAHYLFDETSGTSALDASGNGRTATLSGATFTAGRRGNAVRIAGGTQRVNLPANIVQGCTDVTVATWVRLTTNTAAWARIFDFGASTNLYMFLTPRADATDVLRFAISTAGNAAEQRLSYTYVFPLTTWKHVAVVLGGNTGRLYLDGVEVANNGAIALNPIDLGATPNDWLGDSQFPDPNLDGALDDFRISCRAYAVAEITAMLQ